jgi:predicted kinase
VKPYLKKITKAKGLRGVSQETEHKALTSNPNTEKKKSKKYVKMYNVATLVLKV